MDVKVLDIYEIMGGCYSAKIRRKKEFQWNESIDSRIWLTPPDLKPEVAKVATNFSSRHLSEV